VGGILGGNSNACCFIIGSLEKRGGYEYRRLNDLKNLEWMFKFGEKGAAWDCLKQSRALLNIVMNYQLPTDENN
jgi:hypothetical protein